MIMRVANLRKQPLSSRLALLIIGLVIGVTLIAGCGFELRGDAEMFVPTKIFIEGGNRVFNEQIAERLQQSGSVAVEANNSDAITLSISKIEYQRSARTVDITGLATSYDYTYTIDYQVSGRDGAVLQPLSTIYQQKTLNFDSAQVLQIEEEESFLKRQMEQEIILQLLRRLSQIEQGL